MSVYTRRRAWFFPVAVVLALFSVAAAAAPAFVALEVDKCRFQPKQIKLTSGVDYYLVVQSRGALADHDFVVGDEQNTLQLKKVFARNHLMIYSVSPSAAGKYSYSCKRGIPFAPEQEVTGSSGVIEVVLP